jgi:hypothetical protein
MAPSCEDTAGKQIYQQVAIRDFGMHRIFTRDNSWRDKKKGNIIVVNSLRLWKVHYRK